MAKFIFTGCGPRPISTNAIRWYDPCEGKLIIFFNNSSYDHSIKVTAFGETQWTKVVNAGPVITNCVNGSDYVQTWNSSGFPKAVGCTIDIWRALRDSLWSSSYAITVKLGGRSVADPALTACTAGIELPSSPGLLSHGTTLYKTVSAFVNDCVTDPGVTFTVTVYDDGSFTIT